MTELNEQLQELLARSAQGEEEAFADLYDLAASRVHGVALRVLRSPDHAAEVTQEVFVQVWRVAAHYDPARGSVLAWITTLAHRRAVDRVRSVQRSRVREENWATRHQEPEVDRVWDGVQQHLDEQQVREGLASLPASQREVLTLAYYGGCTHTEVAALLELPLGTVKTRIRDGLIRLRNTMAERS